MPMTAPVPSVSGQWKLPVNFAFPSAPVVTPGFETPMQPRDDTAVTGTPNTPGNTVGPNYKPGRRTWTEITPNL